MNVVCSQGHMWGEQLFSHLSGSAVASRQLFVSLSWSQRHRLQAGRWPANVHSYARQPRSVYRIHQRRNFGICRFQHLEFAARQPLRPIVSTLSNIGWRRNFLCNIDREMYWVRSRFFSAINWQHFTCFLIYLLKVLDTALSFCCFWLTFFLSYS